MGLDVISDSFQRLFKKIKGTARLSEDNIKDILNDIRITLLEADCNVDVIKSFLDETKTKMIGLDVATKLNPSQTVIKIINDEIIHILGDEPKVLKIVNNGISSYMLVGLQGSGKTTMAVKLANYLKNKKDKKVLLVALDVYRPGAIDQLENLGKKVNIYTYADRTSNDSTKIAKDAYQYALYNKFDAIIYDTAGRLSIDESMMEELISLKKLIKPTETLIVVDAMSGQQAVNVVNEFNSKIELTGALMSKLDSDAKGGAALSIAYLTKIYIKFSGTGERPKDFEVFNPSQMASRILGMGDVVKLVETVQEEIDEKEARRLVNKMMNGNFDLNDMLRQIESTRKLGPLGALAKLIPGAPKLTKEQTDAAEKKIKKTRCVIQSMTLQERKNPSILKAERKIRIANGCGMQVSDVNNVLKQYDQLKLQMKQMKSMFGGMLKF